MGCHAPTAGPRVSHTQRQQSVTTVLLHLSRGPCTPRRLPAHSRRTALPLSLWKCRSGDTHSTHDTHDHTTTGRATRATRTQQAAHKGLATAAMRGRPHSIHGLTMRAHKHKACYPRSPPASYQLPPTTGLVTAHVEHHSPRYANNSHHTHSATTTRLSLNRGEPRLSRIVSPALTARTIAHAAVIPASDNRGRRRRSVAATTCFTSSLLSVHSCCHASRPHSDYHFPCNDEGAGRLSVARYPLPFLPTAGCLRLVLCLLSSSCYLVFLIHSSALRFRLSPLCLDTDGQCW